MAKELIENAQRGNLFKMDPTEVVIVGLDTCDGPEHELYDERIKLPVDEGMVLSIMALGVQQVVRVTVRDGVPLVVDGRQRVRAARVANERLVAAGDPPVVVKVEGENAAKISTERLMSTMVALNEIRRSDDALTRAAKADRMRARGMPDRDIALAFGVTTAAISNWAKISRLSPAVKRAVQDGRLSASAAAGLADLPAVEQDAKLEELLASGVKPTTEEVKRQRKPAKEDATEKPSGRIVKKLLTTPDLDLPEDFLLAVRWMRGEISPKRIKGLSAVLAKLEKPVRGET